MWCVVSCAFFFVRGFVVRWYPLVRVMYQLLLLHESHGCFWSCKKNSSGNTAALHAGAGRQRQAIAIKLLYACLGLRVLTDMIMI
jgi:hypothetical protein